MPGSLTHTSEVPPVSQVSISDASRVPSAAKNARSPPLVERMLEYLKSPRFSLMRTSTGKLTSVSLPV